MRVVAGGATARFDIVVYDSANVAVTGLVTGNFTKYLTVDGASDATSVTVTEVANGRYTVTFTAPAVAAGATKYVACVVLHATHAPRGFQEDFEVYNDLALAGVRQDADVADRTPSSLVGGRIDASVGAVAAGAVDSAAFGSGAIDASALAADAANEIADAILKRDIDQVEATAAIHSLCSMTLKHVSKFDGATGKTYRTDGTTLHMTQVVTVDSAADPISAIGVGV